MLEQTDKHTSVKSNQFIWRRKVPSKRSFNFDLLEYLVGEKKIGIRKKTQRDHILN